MKGLLQQELLLAAAKSGHFANTYCAVQVALYLGAKAKVYTHSKSRCHISLRTLEIGVEIAENHPESWQELLENTIPIARDFPVNFSQNPPADILASLGQSGMNVEQQFVEFHRTTGKSRRAFFYQRKKMGLSRQAQSQVAVV